MKKLNFRKKPKLDEVIKQITEVMLTLEPNSDAYTAMAKNLETIYKAKSYENDKGVKWDTVVLAVVNIAGIILVLNYEKLDIITSKAFGLILRGRV